MFDLLPDELAELKVNTILKNCNSAEISEIHEVLREHYEKANKQSDHSSLSAAKSLIAACGMHFQPDSHTEPFRSMAIFGDRRSPNLGDFDRSQIDKLDVTLEQIQHPVLRARLADICFVLSAHKRFHFAKTAVLSYAEIIRKVRDQELFLRTFNENFCGLTIQKLLRRALNISASTRHQPPLFEPLKELGSTLFNCSIEQNLVQSTFALSELSLSFNLVSPSTIGTEIEAFAHTIEDAIWQQELYLLASQAHKKAGNDNDHSKCRGLAAEACRNYAYSQSYPPFRAHWLSRALQLLKDNKLAKNRKAEIHIELVSEQGKISESIMPFTTKTDISDLVIEINKILENATFPEKIKLLLERARPPIAEELKEEAERSFKKYFFSNLFGANHLNSRGLTTKTVQANNFEEGNSEAIFEQAHQHEELRRKLICEASIKPILRSIHISDYIDPKIIGTICKYSPLVPPENKNLIYKGFIEFIKGENAIATAILVPLFENILRHILRTHGHITSNFNEDTGVQADLMLGPLMSSYGEEISNLLGADVYFQIELLFGTAGANLRNKVAHGVYSDYETMSADAIFANCFILLICAYPLFPNWEQYVSAGFPSY